MTTLPILQTYLQELNKLALASGQQPVGQTTAVPASLSAAQIERLQVRGETIQLHLGLSACPEGRDLIQLQDQFSQQAAPLVLEICLQLQPPPQDTAAMLQILQRLFPWFIESIRRRHGFWALVFRRSQLAASPEHLLIKAPAPMLACLQTEGLDLMEDFFRSRAGLEFSCLAEGLPESGPGAPDSWQQQAHSRIKAQIEQQRQLTPEERRAAQQQVVRRVDEYGQPVLDLSQAPQQLQREYQREEAQRQTKEKSKDKRRTPKSANTLWGRLNSDLKINPIKSFVADTGDTQMAGYVWAPEFTLVSNGTRLLVKFMVSDEGGAVDCVIFAKPEDEEELTALIKDGSYLLFEATVQFDGRFSHDLQAIIRGVGKATKPKPREDLAPVKRVELHCHTKMSAKDAVSDAAKILELAASFGHPAVAITDHGVVQSFPEACSTRDKLAKKNQPIKLVYGMEGYLVDDGPVCVYGLDDLTLNDRFVALDLETTGLDPHDEHIIEIGAVRFCRNEQGRFVEADRFSCLINPGCSLSPKIVQLTGLTDMDLLQGKAIFPTLQELSDWLGNDPIVGHNVLFDLGFLRYEGFRTPEENAPRIKFNPVAIDTLAMARIFIPGKNRYTLDAVAGYLGIDIGQHHRATDDALTSARIFLALYQKLGTPTLDELNRLAGRLPRETYMARKIRPFHIILLVRDYVGLYNLYRLVSESHTKYFLSRPRIPRSILTYLRHGLIAGAACERGEVFVAVMNAYREANRDMARARQLLNQAEIKKTARQYDYLEIQPLGNNRFMIRKEGNGILNEEDLMNLNRLVLYLGQISKRPVAATCDSHFLNPEDGIYRKIMLSGMGFDPSEEQAQLYFRNTEEMLAEFSYLDEATRQQAVIEVPRQIAEQCDDGLRPFPEGSYPPLIPEAAENVRNMSWGTARAIYEKDGQLPEIVQERVNKELTSIIDNGFAIMYYIAYCLVRKSNEDGYIVGSRGSVGSSLVATFCGITEVNPLPPHYVCPHCHYSEFYTHGEYGSGYDMPAQKCPVCGQPLHREGQDIPFETFLGFHGDKQPDIDLNFSGVYQPVAHHFIENMFGHSHTFRAGTIGSYADKNALGLVRNYLDETQTFTTEADKRRLASGLVGVKRTTGQHPGGIVVIPKERDVYDFTPIQYPADNEDASMTTTHFDFNAMHDTILKLDILGHLDPTMLKFLSDLTGVKVTDIPIPDDKVMSLFQSTEALGIKPGSTPADCGTLGIPEMGTFMARDMIKETRPTRFYDLVQLMGLSHGTDVWKGNAQDLISSGTCKINEVIGCRDSIMTSLINYGLPSKASFDIMEKVRKGKGLSEEHETLMREHNVPEWYIDSCKKIKYMFPKAHAAAYAISSLRIAWFKVYRPEAYYAAFFTLRSPEFDADLFCCGLEHTIAERERLRGAFSGRDGNPREQKQYYIAELVEEMYYRGIVFLPIDLYASEAVNFKIEAKGQLRPPFSCIANISQAIGEAIVSARASGEPFKSEEDLQQRSGIGQSAVQNLREHGVLGDLPESAQMDIFSLLG
ncbi:MAG: PolC-type DNA polymerase III [Oscillospiraceae bacterium]|nr:PolC-type DNA polymerase III [Oscillospiraceae bacterium]